MHPSVMAYVHEMLTADVVAGAMVLEAGALNVNGSVIGEVMMHDPRGYIGTDLRGGRGVDAVVDAADLPRYFHGFDIVISTEMLEHALDWRSALAGMAECVRMGGLLLVTTRGPGAGRHEHPEDHWRFPTAVLDEAVAGLGFDCYDVRDDPEIPGVLLTARRVRPASPMVDLAVLELIDAEPAPVA